MKTPGHPAPVLVACPDSRPPAYQAVIGLERAQLLRAFLTSYYYKDSPFLRAMGRVLAPRTFDKFERMLKRRHDPEIPAEKVRSALGFDLALRVEARLAGRRQQARSQVARWRTKRFDRVLARLVERASPEVLLAFSDVGSDEALPRCRELGIPVVLSMVHGDVREEREVLDREWRNSPDVFPLYLGDATLDREELDWLHERRLKELGLADMVLVPSEHIAETLARHGTPRSKVRVIPYAADCQRFTPGPGKTHGDICTFLFTGGISQRKGIKYLLEAWRRVRRPGWRLRLLGAPPADLGPLGSLLDGVEMMGRVSHASVPSVMAAADVFVFPSLFEGSAVVTYEALACGLPCVVTPSAGSVVRDDVDGFLVPPADVGLLADRMERLGNDPELRAAMSRSARARAKEFDWVRYHVSVAESVKSLLAAGERRRECPRRPEALA